MKTLYPGTYIFLIVFLFLGVSSPASAQEHLDWDTLADLSFEVNDDGDWVTEFGETVKGLEGKHVKILGFMMPLENTLEQKHFILSMLPLDGCEFCAPGTQAQFLEVKVKGDGIRYTYDPIEVAGTFELIPDAPMGLYFLIKDAKEVK
ncbi:MAG: DUF3299 domain-containing protein [Rhodothermaceae bacterium]|nr:DUF3299 domain-containing protein [Rhodothermaceae bacterium]